MLPLLALLTVPLVQAQWTPELSMKVKTVSTAIPSPDGKLAAWTETHPVMDGDKSEMSTQVYMGRSDGSSRMELTRGEKSANSPAFSPDSEWVFFASDRSGKRNVYRIPVDGGEAEMLTHITGTLGAFAISPNGKFVVFTSRAPDLDEERAKKEKRDFKVIDENPHNQSLWMITVEPDVHGRREGKVVASGNYNIGQFDWSPDSRRIAYETRPTPDADDGRKSDIYEVDLENGNIRPVAATSSTEAQPRYSPDGRYLAFIRSNQTPKRIDGNRIVLMTLADLKVRELPPTPDQSPSIDAWAKDGSRIYFSEGLHTREALYQMPVDGPPTIVFHPARGTFGNNVSFNRTGTYAGMTMQTPDEPVEAYVMPLASMKPVRVSAANVDIPRTGLGETKVIKWKAKDGKEIEGLLTYPANYDKSKKYPLILNIHGGPAGNFNETFIGASGLYPIASFAAKGWAVLRANPRGSTGYGIPFRAANLNDWGGDDYQDLMSGVDAVIAMGVADPNRMAVMGWSYGGFMTNWVVGHTNRFKCAVAGAGISSLISMWGTNDIPTTIDDYFEGEWYVHPDRYIKSSPLAYVQNSTTPQLILHGEADIRVPTSQGYEMYHNLKAKGVPTEMVVYPRTPHGPQEPKFVLDIMHRHIDWVAKYIGD